MSGGCGKKSAPIKPFPFPNTVSKTGSSGKKRSSDAKSGDSEAKKLKPAYTSSSSESSESDTGDDSGKIRNHCVSWLNKIQFCPTYRG